MSRLAPARVARPSLLVGLWAPPLQTISSARTSGPRLAALLKNAPLLPGTVNADLGGGAFEFGTAFLRGRDVQNIVYDPFNRSPHFNHDAVSRLQGGQAHSATIANVLNVIREPSARHQLILQAADVIGDHPGRSAYFSVYYDRSRPPGLTPYGWQEHRPLATYAPEVAKVFREVSTANGILTARDPRLHLLRPRRSSPRRALRQDAA